METDQRQLIKKYLDILLRHKKIVVAGLLIGMASGLGQYLKTPKVYQCQSMIKYQRQRINPSQMSPDDLRSGTREAVSTVSQQITSRTSLEALIKEFDLYAEARRHLPMEDIVDIMREKHIDIGTDRGDIFRVAYQGSDPKKVMRVTNALSAKFIEENLRFREERASETSKYVRDELSMAKEALDKKESVMRDYKLQYYNEMPDQRNTNMGRLNALQEQYQNNQVSTQDLERTGALIREQISLREELLAQQFAGISGGATGVPTMSGARQLRGPLEEINQMRQELSNLQLRYTEKHPEVKRLKKMIQERESQQASKVDLVEGEGEESSGQENGTQRFQDPQLEELKLQFQNVKYSIERLQKERVDIRAQIDKYQKWVEAAPVREAEWAGLTRDYEQLHSHYQQLVAQNISAESAHSLEKAQKGSRFKIVDPAHFPEKPFKPDLKKMMLMTIGLGLGLGGGFAFVVELLNTSFKEPEDLEAYLDVPVICAIPLIHTARERIKIRVFQLFWWGIFVVSFGGILGATVYFWRKGMIIL
jgi:polysaccharide biosynthesis transport protein